MSLVSIVIPCRNEIRYISNLLNSIKSSDYPQSLIEIIVVDGMSDDGTRDLLSRDFIKKYDNIKLLDNLKKNTPFAFNLGIKVSNGEYLIVLGARHVISRNYISQAVDTLKSNEEIGCLGGVVKNIFENKTSEIISSAMASPFGVGFSNFRTCNKDSFVDSIGSPCFRMKIFNEIGYFDERLSRNQDDDYSYRVINAGYKILLKANISVQYNVRASFKNLFTQYRQYGYWKVFVNKKHNSVTTMRQLFPMFLILSIFLLTFLSVFNFGFIYLLGFELALYTSLSLYFSVKDNGFNLKNGIMQMYTCLTLHISYGFGYLEGIYDFILLDRLPNQKNEKLSR